MDFELPSQFDLIVVGTGLTESIVAAAASRIGKNVLHVDDNNYYGGLWASFSLECIGNLHKSGCNNLSDREDKIDQCITFGNDLFIISDVKEEWHIPEDNIDDGINPSDTTPGDHNNEGDKLSWSKNKLLSISRKFNIDLMPKLHFAKGDFVELMISSNIARYSEFRSVSRVLTWLNNKLEVVPCSRSDVFSSDNVTVVEKRLLMKLLNVCLDSPDQDFADYKNKTFRAFLKDQKLTHNLIHYILYAIAMGNDEMCCQEGVDNIKRFLNSLGRYGKTPFLYSMYGSGEIPQAFCRLSAVFGATYALSRPLQGLEFDQTNKFQSLICGKQKLKACNLVMGLDKAPKQFVKDIKFCKLSRGIFIIDRSVLESEKEHLSLLLFPPLNNKKPITVIEMGCLTGTCPKGLYLVHMITNQMSDPCNDLKDCVDILFSNGEINTEKGDVELKPKLLWSFYFSMPIAKETNHENNSNFFICPGPDADLDYDNSIKAAKEIFEKMYPGCEFLPRAPDPEEIIIEGEESPENKESVSQDEKVQNQNEENETTEAVNKDT